MINRLRLSTRIHLAVALPALALLIASLFHLNDKWRDLQELGKIREMAGLAQVGGQLIHSLAAERGATAYFLGSEGLSFAEEMATARQETDSSIRTWHAFAGEPDFQILDDNLRRSLASVQRALDQLKPMRERVDARTVTPLGQTAFYTEANALLLTAIVQFGRISSQVELATLVAAYTSLIRGKEALGQQRAAGSLGFSAGHFDLVLFQRFLAATGSQNAYFAQFGEYAPPDLALRMREILSSLAMQEIDWLRDEVARAGPGGPLESRGGEKWFHTVTAVINAINGLAHRVEERIVTVSEREYHIARGGLWVATALTLVMVMITFWIGYVIARGVRDTLATSSNALVRLAKGNLEVALQPGDFPGEARAIYDALQAFRESLVSRRNLTEELTRARDELALINANLEQRVAERTADLRLAASVFENTAEGIMVTDTAGTIISVNPAFSAITGYAAEEVIGETPRLLKSDHHPPEFYRAMWGDLLATGFWEGQVWNRRKGGEAFLEWQTISVVPDQEGKPLRYVAVFNDVTELHHKDERLRHQAYHDVLTGLPNRLLLQDRLRHDMDVAARNSEVLATMVLDLDNFKLINDSLGHDVGDLLLQEIARRLTACLRQSDTVARTGGDEFVIVLTQVSDATEVAHTGDRIIRSLALPVAVAGQELHTAGSLGIAFYPEDSTDPVALIKNADMAMYQAKADGRGTYRFFDAEMNRRSANRMAVETALRRSLEAQEFALAYQPKVDLTHGNPQGLEVLVRWPHPTLGTVPPSEFIPIAEDSGLIVPLGSWVIIATCRQMKLWRDDGNVIPRIAVNLSARQFADAQLVDFIAEQLNIHELPPHCLELEVTESTVMTDPEKAIATLERLHRLGVRIAVDDFGTGYSSLSYLKRLPLDILKIDRSFVKDICTDAEDAAIARTIIALGQTLGLQVVAEGIETEAQRAALLTMGCTIGQGFLFAAPQPPEAAVRFLEKA